MKNDIAGLNRHFIHYKMQHICDLPSHIQAESQKRHFAGLCYEPVAPAKQDIQITEISKNQVVNCHI